MAVGPNDTDLTTLLPRTIEAYADGWKAVDEELYGLCRRRNGTLLER